MSERISIKSKPTSLMFVHVYPFTEINLALIKSLCICFQFAYKDGFEYMKTTLETEELDAPVGQVMHNKHCTAVSKVTLKSMVENSLTSNSKDKVKLSVWLDFLKHLFLSFFNFLFVYCELPQIHVL